MTIAEYLGIPKRKGRISNQTRAKCRHDYGILMSAKKPRGLTMRCLSGMYRISLSSVYKIVK